MYKKQCTKTNKTGETAMKKMDMIKPSMRTGLCFGLTSAIITTLGLIVGLAFGTKSESIVMAGILTIAIADAMSDALGIHISEESDKRNSHSEVWKATIVTFFTKLLFALTFLVPMLLFDLYTALIISSVWGLSVLALLSYYIAKQNKDNPFKVVMEHLTVAVAVIIITYFVGTWINGYFGGV